MDGSKGAASSPSAAASPAAAAAPAPMPAADRASRKKTLLFGEAVPGTAAVTPKPDDAPMSTSDISPSLRAPATPAAESAAKFDLERTPPPADAKPVAEPNVAAAVEPHKAADKAAPAVKPETSKPETSKPETSKPETSKPEKATADAAARSPRPAKVEPKDKAAASADKSEGKPAGRIDLSRSAKTAAKADHAAPEAASPEKPVEADAKVAKAASHAVSADNGADEAARTDKDAAQAVKHDNVPKEGPKDETAVAHVAKADKPADSAVKDPHEPKIVLPKPGVATAKTDGPSSKRGGRAAMELGGVFAVPSKGAKPAKDAPQKADGDVDVDVDVDLDADEKPLDFAPILAQPPKPKPPSPQLKKVVLDMGDVGETAPESKELPSVAFFSPVLIPQMQLSQPSAVQPLLSAPEADPDDKPKGMKSSQGLLWAAVIAVAGILFAGAFLLWNQLKTPAQLPQSRTGADVPTATVPVIQAPMAQSAAQPSAAASLAEPAASATAVASADTAKPAPADTLAKATADTRKEPGAATPADGTKKAPASETPAATAPATAEAKQPEPSKVPTKQPQPTESSEIPFDKAAAASALAARKGLASGCKQEGGPTGHAKVSVTFAPSGRVTSANVNGPPFAGTPVGGCIASKFRGATVPPFSGGPVTVHTSVAIF